MAYEDISRFVQQGGTIFFIVIFVLGLVYALKPAKKAEFDRAARMPLDEDD